MPGARFRFILCLCMVISFIGGIHSNSLASSPTPTASNPWGAVPTGGNICPLDSYYSSPMEAAQAFAGRAGAQIAFAGVEQDGNGYPRYIFDVHGGTVCPNIYSVAVGYAYTGGNYGQVCPDTSYVTLGGSCPPYVPPVKQAGNPNDPECRSGGCGVGKPIDVATGNMYESMLDYTTAGMNKLAFTRYYNSLPPATTYAVSLGKNWRHNYDRYINVISGSSVRLERADGQQLNFTLVSSVWKGDSDIDLTLTHTGSGTGSTWVLTDTNDTKENYTQLASGQGQLTSVVARNGYTQTLTYNGSNQLTRVQDSYSRQLNFTYTGTLLTIFTTVDGLVITYNYDISGITPGVTDRLRGMSYATSPVTSKGLNYSSGTLYLTSITDENSNALYSWTYDSFGRGTTSQRAGGVDKTTMGYIYANDATHTVHVGYMDGFANQLNTGPSVFNGLGLQENYRFTAGQGVAKVSNIIRPGVFKADGTTPINYSVAYDSNGYSAGYKDWRDYVTTQVNDTHGQPTMITQSGDGVHAPSRTTTYSYDSTWVHLPALITYPRKTVAFTYDASGNMATRTETDASGGSTNGQTRAWSYTYDSTGHVLTVTGPRTDVTQTTTYTYSGNNIATITNALGQVTTITSYTAGGLPLSSTDANSVVSTYAYDTRKRLTTYTVQATAGNVVTSFTYDATGNITRVTLPDSSYLNYTYDTANRVTRVTDSTGGYEAYTYDADSNILTAKRYNAAGTLAKKQCMVYDTLNRMLQSVGAVSQATVYTYDANDNLHTINDPLNHQQKFELDAFNRIYEHDDMLNTAHALPHDAADNLSQVIFNSTGTVYTYDGFDRVISTNSPDTNITTYTLDKVGNRISETDARGIVTNRTFDKLNRVVTVTYPASTGENITYYWDNSSGGHYQVGRLAGVTDDSGSTFYDYNERGDVVADNRVINATNYQTQYTYDLSDHISTITYPSGHVITITRDAMGRIASMMYKPSSTGTAQNLVTAIGYKAFSQLPYGFTFGNGLTRSLTYDQDYRLTNIVTTGVQNLTMAYNVSDNVTSITDIIDTTRNQSFTYDANYRLTAATGKYGALSYTYDVVGNRTQKTDGGVSRNYTYSQDSGHTPFNFLINMTDASSGSVVRTFSYVAGTGGNITNGDMLTDSAVGTYSWNNRNRLSQAVNYSSVTSTYKYNAFGQRVRKVVGSTGTNYVYDTSGKVIAEYNGSTLIREYVYLNSQPLAQIEGTNIYFIHNDHLGTPQKMTNSSGTVVWDRIQKPFGETYSITGTLTNNLRAPGQYFDSETGLHYNYYRYYDPTLGRYISADQIGMAGGYSLYTYVGNNPVRYTDTRGLSPNVPPPGQLPPPENVPGGPWNWFPDSTNPRGGDFQGPKQPKGPRARCTYAPPHTVNDNPEEYWKTTDPDTDEQQRWNRNGDPIPPETAHPSPQQKPNLPSVPPEIPPFSIPPSLPVILIPDTLLHQSPLDQGGIV